MNRISIITASLIIKVDSRISYFALNDAINYFVYQSIKEKIKWIYLY